jgi:bifunctional DNase/RNase
LVDGVFYSSIICERDKIEEIIDARTSDAIALALRFDAPIFTYKAILDKAGIFLKTTPKKKKDDISKEEEAVIEELILGEDKESVKPKGEDYSKFTRKELNQLLNKAVANEDYETAARIRDEISKR